MSDNGAESNGKSGLAAMLRLQIEAGVTDMLAEEPINRYNVLPPARGASGGNAPKAAPNEAAPIAHAEPQKTDMASVAEAEKCAAQADSLEALAKAMADFDGCPLKKTAKNTVFADGNPKAKLMLIGEAPGRDEDREGKPFVGPSGQLLDKIFACIGLTRQDFYITNMIAWRPPGNRAPTPDEIALCLPFLHRHIALLAPDIIVLVGGVAAKQLLNTDKGITQTRGTWNKITSDGRDIPALAIFHPAYLLRTPMRKAETWRDILSLQDKMRELKMKDTAS